MHDRDPVGVGLGVAKPQSVKSGSGRLEADAAARLPAAVRPVTGGARPLVQVGAALAFAAGAGGASDAERGRQEDHVRIGVS